MQSPVSYVLLLHGIWMRRSITLRLAQRLRAAGYRVHALSYASVTAPFAAHHARIDQALATVDPAHTHFVGHSLGGLVVLDYLRTHSERYPHARAVCLGSPLCGSEMAERLRRLHLDTLGMGQARHILLKGLPEWTGPQAVGVIAGDLPLGWNVLLGRLPKPNDGTVAVRETKLPGIRDHRVVHASHTGLLFSDPAARLCIEFLRSGVFPASAAG